MATEAKTVIWFVNLGGTLANVGSMKYAWRGHKDTYKNIGAALGVTQAKDTDKGLMFGSNSPTPALVRIGYTKSNGSSASAVRFCEPDKIGGVTTGGTLNGKKIVIKGTEYNINKVTLKTN